MGKRLEVSLWIALAVGLLMGWQGHTLLAEETGEEAIGLDFAVTEEPIRVSAKTLEWDHKAHRATFHSEVVARQKDLEIYSDDLMVFFNETDNDVTRLVAKGNVTIIQLDRRATCEEAVYDRSQNRLVLEGDPVIRQGQNEVRGRRVIFYVEERRSVVEGGEGGRVKVTLVPEKGEVGSLP
jgi:lipopolysaccharide export system protein LptA